MALPNKKIRKVKLPGDSDNYEVVPAMMQDGSTNYKGSLPTLTADSTIAVIGNNITANPESTTTDLTSLKIGSTNYKVTDGTVKSVNGSSPDSSGNVTISIPTVNNATLTIQQNSTTVNTFTANASSNVTANIVTPQVYRYI